jgi:hypothetical protein
MSLWREFWADEHGALISAELAAVGTVAVVATTAGLSAVSKSLTEEMKEVAVSVRSLNQSYSFAGHTGCRAWTAGSSYIQPDANQSIQDLVGTTPVERKIVVPPTPAEPANQRHREDEDRRPENRRKDDDRGRDNRRQDDDRGRSSLPQTENQRTAVEDADDESQVETVLPAVN